MALLARTRRRHAHPIIAAVTASTAAVHPVVRTERIGRTMEGEQFELFVPGRICVFGEHSDWAGGYRKHAPHVPKGACIVSGTNQGLWARVHKQPLRADGSAHNVLTLTSSTSTGEVRGPHELPLEREALLAVARAGGYWSYAAGVAHAIIDRFEIDRGLVVVNFKTSLPSEKGLSSSAALCVLMARAFSRAYKLRLTVAGEMELAYLGERTTVRCPSARLRRRARHLADADIAWRRAFGAPC